MSGSGRPSDLAVEGARDLRVGVVAASWHEEIMGSLLEGALRVLGECGVEAPTVVRVPGSFELPVVVRRLAELRYDAVVALGVVIRGGTPHFDYVCSGVTDGLMRVMLDTGVPVGFGVLTCDNEEQARERSGIPGSREDKGYDTALAAVATAVSLRGLGHG